MKNIKKILALVLALTMVLSMSAVVFAADGDATPENPGSITIKASVEDKNYDLYKIFDLTGSNETNGVYANVAYTVNPDWNGFFFAEEGETAPGAGYIVAEKADGLNPISIDGETKYINITENNVAQFAQDALDFAAKNNVAIDKTAEGTGEDLTVNNLELGYYLVYPRGAADVKNDYASICSLTSTVPTAEIEVKAEYPTVDKNITEEDEDPTKLNEAAIGDIVPYTITTKIPDMTGYTKYFFVAHDTLSDGLSLNNEIVDGKNTGFTVKIGDTDLTEGDDYDVDIAADGQSFRIIFKNMVSRQDDAGKTVTIAYTATLNEEALVNQANTNTATIEYSNDPSVKPEWDEGEEPENPDDPEDPNYKFKKGDEEVEPTEESEESETETYTTSLTLQKVDEKGNILSGAEFELTGEALNEVRVSTSVSFEEAEDGTYFKLANGKYTEDAPVAEHVEADEDGEYVEGTATHEGQEEFTIGDKTYCAVVEGEDYPEGTVFYKHILSNADLYANDGKLYKKTVNTTVLGNTEEVTPVKAYVDATTGLLTFEGLKSGEYILTETTTPDGYNTIDPITFTVSFDEDTKSFSGTDPIDLALTEIVNKSGKELPETGGIGTTIFYILGGILLAGAAVLLVTKKRMSTEA